MEPAWAVAGCRRRRSLGLDGRADAGAARAPLPATSPACKRPPAHRAGGRYLVDLSAHDSRNWRHFLTPFASAPDDPESESVTPRAHIQTQRHLDHEGQAKVAAAYQEGKTMNEVARQFGLHRTTVRAILDRARVTVRPREMTAAQVNLAIKLYADGLSLQTVGERLGFNAQTIANRLQDQGVRMRSPHERA